MTKRLGKGHVEELRRGVLSLVGGRGLAEDPLDLGADPRPVPVLVERGVRADLGPVDRDLAEGAEPRRITDLQHLDEDGCDRHLVLGAKGGDRPVVGDEVHRDHLVGEIAPTPGHDRPRGAHAGRIGVEQEAEQHLGVVCGSPRAAGVGIVERRGVDELHGVDHEVGEVVLLQPVGHGRREQEELVPISHPIAICHAITIAGQG